MATDVHSETDGLAARTGDGLHSDLTRQIISAAYEVHNHLGHGFLERVYVRAMLSELEAKGLEATAEAPIAVFYKGIEIGLYFADILVNSAVICEVKAVRRHLPEHNAQLLHYLRATGVKVGLLLNFGASRVEIKRLVLG